jgi:undecaprenyl-phosphate 4-deoxy-4-formamido-L-arabinose transferase
MSKEINTYIPALAYSYSHNPTEIVVEHEERSAGESKYSMLALVRLNFDLITGFSIAPLQIFSILGMIVSLISFGFFVLLVVRRFVVGPEAEGLFTLFSIAFFLIGIVLLGLGLVGEYVGRIYQQVRERPRFMIQALLENDDNKVTVDARKSDVYR